MSSSLNQLSKTLEPVFKDLPPLPKGAKDWLVKAWPVLALILGVLQLLAAWSLWHLGHLVNNLVTYTNALARAYGTGVTVNNLGLFYWLSLAALVINGAIFLLAFPGLKARAQAGWNMLFLGALVNVVYGVFAAFDSGYGSIGNLVMSLFGSVIGFYLLFQIRSAYFVKTETK